jgi:hypothetical protein
MGRTLAILALLACLGGCYNPRFPSEAPSAATQDEPPPGNVVRDRRNEAAGSGASSR